MAWSTDEAFEIYVDDDRYAVPTLHLVPAEDEDAALKVARRLVLECEHHLGAEVCIDGRRLAGLGTFASRRAIAGQPQPSAGSCA